MPRPEMEPFPSTYNNVSYKSVGSPMLSPQTTGSYTAVGSMQQVLLPGFGELGHPSGVTCFHPTQVGLHSMNMQTRLSPVKVPVSPHLVSSGHGVVTSPTLQQVQMQPVPVASMQRFQIQQAAVPVQRVQVQQQLPVQVQTVQQVVRQVPVQTVRTVPVQVQQVQMQPVQIQSVQLEPVQWEEPVEPIRWETYEPPPSPPPPVQHQAPPPPPPEPEIHYVDKLVEVPVEVKKYVEVEVPVEVTKTVEVEKVVNKIVKKNIEVPVEVEKKVEVPVPYERIVHVEVPVERIVYRDVPVAVQSGEERVVTKEIQVPVEVVREVPVPVEHIVYKEVQVPVEVGMRQETRVGEGFTVVGTETRRSGQMTAEHVRSPIADVRSYDLENRVRYGGSTIDPRNASSLPLADARTGAAESRQADGAYPGYSPGSRPRDVTGGQE